MKKLCKSSNYTNIDKAIYCADCGERIDEEFNYELLGFAFFFAFLIIILLGLSLLS